jgi:hypothetical protein
MKSANEKLNSREKKYGKIFFREEDVYVISIC